jgi:uncharacterized protein YgbK (DUF1537 family)
MSRRRPAGASWRRTSSDFGLEDVRGDLGPRLRALTGNVCGVVDAERQSDLDSFARQVLDAAGQGKRFLFRSAASLLTALAALPPQPVAPAAMSTYVRDGRPGVVLMGSHVEKSTRQLRISSITRTSSRSRSIWIACSPTRMRC